jgi:hypothetical protein
VVCKACSKRFEIPSMHSLLFVDQLEGLPRDVEDDEPAPAAPPEAAAGPGQRGTPSGGTARPERREPRRVTSLPRGWRG